MAYGNDYDSGSRVEPGISRRPASSGQRSGSARPAGYTSGSRQPQRGTSSQRSASGQRGYSSRPASSGQRSASRSASGQRSASSQRGYSSRPSSSRQGSGGSRRSSGGRKAPNRFPLFAVAAVLVVVLILVIAKPFGRPAQDPVADGPVVPASNEVQTASPAAQSVPEDDVPQYDNLEDQLADEEYDVGSLSAEQMATVTDLRMNTSLPSEWMNVLLLGTDERTLSDSARTDAMLICSINRNTGEVKLASIMRDLAIEYTDIGQWNGTYRINAANYFGGPNLAMRTVNEKFNLNIQYYAMVNFFGFQKIAQRLGGIDIDITEEEMNKINIMIVRQAKAAAAAGIDESDQENVFLETYGPNTHLNGRQTLAYARIRKLTGGDAMRTERQRKVLQKLLEKMKQLDAMQLAALATDMFDQVKTNLPFDDIFQIAMQVSTNGLPSIKSMYLPMSGTYKEETRNNQSMLYDCDFATNALQLYNFIYEQ